jgi:phosphate starvation-inducible PhoH-like protein
MMVSLLGARDENLKLIEQSLASDILVRGNEITLSGAPADNALAERVFSELLELIAKGETLSTEVVRRIIGMLKQGTEERPADVLTLNILSRRGRTVRSVTWTRSTATPSSSASVRPAPARPTWRWPRRSRRCRPSR